MLGLEGPLMIERLRLEFEGCCSLCCSLPPSRGYPVNGGTPQFDVAAFLASAGLGRRIIQLAPNGAFFTQGDPADSVFYLQNGRARVTVVSATGKEATSPFPEGSFLVGRPSILWREDRL
jgi:hypothetical protein